MDDTFGALFNLIHVGPVGLRDIQWVGHPAYNLWQMSETKEETQTGLFKLNACGNLVEDNFAHSRIHPTSTG